MRLEVQLRIVAVVEAGFAGAEFSDFQVVGGLAELLGVRDIAADIGEPAVERDAFGDGLAGGEVPDEHDLALVQRGVGR